MITPQPTRVPLRNMQPPPPRSQAARSVRALPAAQGAQSAADDRATPNPASGLLSLTDLTSAASAADGGGSAPAVMPLLQGATILQIDDEDSDSSSDAGGGEDGGGGGGGDSDAADDLGAPPPLPPPPLRPDEPPQQHTDQAILEEMVQNEDAVVVRERLVAAGVLDPTFTAADVMARFTELCTLAAGMEDQDVV